MKWDLPPGPVPSWLDASMEVLAVHEPPKLPRDVFVLRCVDVLVELGLSLELAWTITANAIVETGWGQAYRGWNLGGWKLWKADADAYFKKHGRKIAWYRAPGNKAPGATLEDLKGGDPPWCFYRVFGSMSEFLSAWLRVFVPKPGAPKSRYTKCGAQFWSGQEWFDDLIAAGYKGTRTQQNPDPSMKSHAHLVADVRERWCQRELGVKPDGAWGPQSSRACVKFQYLAGLPAKGRLDDRTVHALVTRATAR